MRLIGMEENRLESFNYLNMVTKAAWKTWRLLPPHTRGWISVEDLVMDGLHWVEAKGLKRWDKKKGCLSTLIYRGVDWYFETFYLQKYANHTTNGISKPNQGRSEHSTISVQDKEQFYREQGMEFEFERALGLEVKSQKTMEQEFLDCLVVESMIRLRAKASPELRQKISEWFLGSAHWQEKPITWRTGTWEFSRQAREFRTLAGQQGITIHDCRHLLSSPTCLDKLSRELTWLPFSYTFPNPEEGLR